MILRKGLSFPPCAHHALGCSRIVVPSLNPGLPSDPGFTVGQAVTTAISPDGNTLLILTSGFNSQNFTSGPNKGNTNPDEATNTFLYSISPVESRCKNKFSKCLTLSMGWRSIRAEKSFTSMAGERQRALL